MPKIYLNALRLGNTTEEALPLGNLFQQNFDYNWLIRKKFKKAVASTQ